MVSSSAKPERLRGNLTCSFVSQLFPLRADGGRLRNPATTNSMKNEDVWEVWEMFHLPQTCVTETLLAAAVKASCPASPTGTGGERSPSVMPMGCRGGGEMEMLAYPGKRTHLLLAQQHLMNNLNNLLICWLPS